MPAKAKRTQKRATKPANKSGLTAKQRLFVAEYCACLNATEAARRAGYSIPRQTGSENLSKPVIRAAIDKTLESRIMQPLEVLSRLSEMATASIEDFYNIGATFAIIDLNKAREAGKLHLVKSIKLNKFGQPELELHDQRAALETMAKYHKLLTTKIEVSDWRKEAEEKNVPAGDLFEKLIQSFAEQLKDD